MLIPKGNNSRTKEVSRKLPDNDPSGSKHAAGTQNNRQMLIQ
jgi:hypothetical protein